MYRTINGSYDAVFNDCKLALKQLEWSLKYQSKRDGIIAAETGSSIFSWGEIIDIKIDDRNPSRIKVSVKSTSKAQLFDWGKNETNEEKFLTRLTRLTDSR